MTRKSTNAIKFLEECLTELENINDSSSSEIWRAKLQHALILYLGEDSPITQKLRNLRFSTMTTIMKQGGVRGYYSGHDYVYDNKNKTSFRDLVVSAISLIKSDGLKENYVRTNWLSGFSNVHINAGIAASLTVLLGFAYWWGNSSGTQAKEREILDVERKFTEVNKKREEFEKKYNELQLECNKLQEQIKTLKKSQ